MPAGRPDGDAGAKLGSVGGGGSGVEFSVTRYLYRQFGSFRRGHARSRPGRGIGRGRRLLSNWIVPWTDGGPSNVAARGRSQRRLPAVPESLSRGLREPAGAADEGSVTTFARSLSSLAHTCAATVRARSLMAVLVASLAATLLIASPAQALIAEVEGTKVGLQPRNGTSLGQVTLGAEDPTFANASGNVVLHGTGDYAIYWDPNDQFHHEWLVHLDGFFQSLGEANDGTPFGDLGQYRDRSNAITPFHASFKGSYSDTTKFPSAGCTDPNPLEHGAVTCLTDAQLREQLQAFIASHDLPKGMGTVYYLLTPPGVTVCLNAAATRCSDYKLSNQEAAEERRESVSYEESFCSYHSDINPDDAPEGDSNTILYAAIPWTAGTLGLAGYWPDKRVYENSFDCQDGGFNPEKHEEHREVERELTAEEEAALKKDTAKKRLEEEEARRLEGPHVEEPNQEGKGEEGDYSPGLSDVLINQISEEAMNIVTDPLLSSWHSAAGNEATDLCRNQFDATAGASGGEIGGSVVADPHTEAGSLSNVSLGAGRYYINNVFSLSSGVCEGGIGLLARFTTPDPVNAGEIVGVDGMESTVSLIAGDAFGPSGPPTPTYATFSWNFGDGTPEVEGYAPGAPQCEAPWLSPCAASAFHAYQYGGTYKVTLTITDVAGNTTSVTHEVTVDGPAAPAAPGPALGANPGAGAAAGHLAIPTPVAAAAILRQSLKTALRKGLVVSYSVNEQVAGHFELLLSRAVARKLGIGGPLATDLPAGSPAEIVVGKEILVTTKGGRSAVHIQFSKSAAARLAHVHKVSLMLRLIVRNAASVDPLTSAVVSSATLSA
jgi:hypothetical protein